MQKIKFSKSINADKSRVWNSLWDLGSYRKWTSVFAEGSDVETANWEKGSKVLFVDGNRSGMVARVAANRPNEFMSFEHLGVVKDGVEDTSSDEVKKWAGAYENYTLAEQDGKTELTVEMDINDEYKDYFLKTWPLALDKVKELSEN